MSGSVSTRSKLIMVGEVPEVMLYGHADEDGDVFVRVKKRGGNYHLTIYGVSPQDWEEVVGQRTIQKAVDTKILETPFGAVIALTSLVAIRIIMAA